MSKQFTYSKIEKLKSRKLIDQLFNEGKSYSAFPVKVLYKFVEESDCPLKGGVAVSSRNFKRAVDRNRIKRLLREGYRLNKLALHQALVAEEKSMILFFIYQGREIPDQVLVTEKITELLNKLEQKVSAKK